MVWSATLEEIGAKLDLRKAARGAIESIVFELGRHNEIDSLPKPFEGVADVATGVHKTYMLAATLDDLTGIGARHFLFRSRFGIVFHDNDFVDDARREIPLDHVVDGVSFGIRAEYH